MVLGRLSEIADDMKKDLMSYTCPTCTMTHKVLRGELKYKLDENDFGLSYVYWVECPHCKIEVRPRNLKVEKYCYENDDKFTNRV